jgi:hypothetical protein
LVSLFCSLWPLCVRPAPRPPIEERCYLSGWASPSRWTVDLMVPFSLAIFSSVGVELREGVLYGVF